MRLSISVLNFLSINLVLITTKAERITDMARILIIEDEEGTRRIFKRVFEKAGYDVLDAPNGKIISKLHDMEPVDLVITDIFMPEKEGLETIRELRRDFPKIKIIAMSGGGTIGSAAPSITDCLKIAEKLGVQTTFEKPFELKKMLKTVEQLLG